jgi:bile acid:Na+ symporter, BASS family
MIDAIDQVKLNFNSDSLRILNFVIAFIMFGVALEIKKNDFTSVLHNKRAFVIGMFSQFIFFPFFAYLLTIIFNIPASISLGLLLVASCPGGNLSNFLTSYSGGNSALSISMSSASTIASIIMTPLNLSFWASMNPKTQVLIQSISIDGWKVFQTVMIILIIPSALGIATNVFLPKVSAKLQQPFKKLSMVFFIVFLAGALFNNFENFKDHIGKVFFFVALTNLMGLSFGFSVSKLCKLGIENAKAVAFETGIQNAGFGLVLIFNFFDGLGGMAIVAGWYGIWHMITGLSLAIVWSKKLQKSEALSTIA